MTKENQASWPTKRTDGTEPRSPTAFFVNPDTTMKLDRSVAGPLRMGTAPGVGPSGSPGAGASDFGLDRITPRRFDPIGNHLTREGVRDPSSLVSRDLRSNNRRKED